MGEPAMDISSSAVDFASLSYLEHCGLYSLDREKADSLLKEGKLEFITKKTMKVYGIPFIRNATYRYLSKIDSVAAEVRATHCLRKVLKEKGLHWQEYYVEAEVEFYRWK